MLKDLDQALKASTNYIENHRSTQLPNGGVQEYHEYRSTTTSGGTPRNVGDDFNLERQVQHMMPNSQIQQHQAGSTSYSGLQSANMVSSMQQSSSSTKYTSYKVQSNSYSSGGNRIENSGGSSRLDYDSNPSSNQHSAERPGSRLKANIDELDTLLSDLNNAQSHRGAPSGGSMHHHETSSEDYGDQSSHLQGNVKKTITSMNEYTSMSSNNDYNRKPPSPSPRRRTPVHMSCSPAPPRRTSPSPVPHSPRRTSPPSFRSQSPPRKRSPSPVKIEAYNQAGQGYYSKYASSSSYASNTHTSGGHGPASFPTCPSPSPASRPSVQTPPKKVDDLMTELSEFDPSIQHTTFNEPSSSTRMKYSMDRDESRTTTHHIRREPSPGFEPGPARQPSSPAVYYPQGEMFSSTRNDSTDVSKPVQPAGESAASFETNSGARGRAKVRAEYGYKEKGRYNESTGESKQGAAVVPICLPLCCAAPCVIL